jgi:hypothetical protein
MALLIVDKYEMQLYPGFPSEFLIATCVIGLKSKRESKLILPAVLATSTLLLKTQKICLVACIAIKVNIS